MRAPGSGGSVSPVLDLPISWLVKEAEGRRRCGRPLLKCEKWRTPCFGAAFKDNPVILSGFIRTRSVITLPPD